MPSTVSWPEVGGATAHPTGATLALGDPSVSLNVPQRRLSYHWQQRALILAPWAAGWLALVPVAAACAAIEFEQDSGTRSAPLHHRGSTALAFCLTVFVPESRAVPPFRSKREVHLEGIGVAVMWPWVVAVWPGDDQLRRRIYTFPEGVAVSLQRLHLNISVCKYFLNPKIRHSK